jgi:hypothetical protein
MVLLDRRWEFFSFLTILVFLADIEEFIVPLLYFIFVRCKLEGDMTLFVFSVLSSM